MSIERQDLELIVKTSVHETLANLGFTPDEPHKVQADMMYLRKKREGADEALLWAQRGIITTLIGAGLFALWNGLVHLIKGN
jgi:hypothetical protein